MNNQELNSMIKVELEKSYLKDKIIDMLIDNIITHNIPDDFCMRYGKRKKTCKTLDDNEKCKECIREYYFKKARGEEDEQR